MLKYDILVLKHELEEENNNRSKKMNSGECSEYEHTALVHMYNNTLDIIKRLDKITNRH